MSRITTHLFYLAAILSCILLLASCQSPDKIDIRKYYFAEGDMNTTRLYVFRPVGAASDAPADYWLQQLMQTDSGTYLYSQYFDRDKVCRQKALERITATGSVQKELRIIEKDSLGQLMETHAELVSAAMYPFEVLDTNTMIVYEVKYPLPGNQNQKVVIRRNRRYAGPGPQFSLQGKSYTTIRMVIAETISSVGEGSATITGTGEEWYAEGLGRVYYRKTYGKGEISEEYRLEEVRVCEAGKECL